MQESLLASLVKDNLIKSTNEVTFTNEKDQMYVNGKALAEAQYEKYSGMFRKAGIQSNADFSFYKKDDHIVIIGLNAKIKKVFNDLYKGGHIASTDEAVKLLIDGDACLLAEDSGRPFRRHSLNDVREVLHTLPLAGAKLRQTSAYDEMIGQPPREGSNVMEVPLGLEVYPLPKTH